MLKVVLGVGAIPQLMTKINSATKIDKKEPKITCSPAQDNRPEYNPNNPGPSPGNHPELKYLGTINSE